MKKLKESIVNFKSKHSKGLKALSKGLNVFIIVVLTFLVGLFFVGAVKGCFGGSSDSSNQSTLNLSQSRSEVSRFVVGTNTLESYFTSSNYLNVDGQSNHYDQTKSGYIYTFNPRSDVNMIFFNPSSSSVYSNINYSSSSVTTNILTPSNATLFSNTWFFGGIQLYYVNANGLGQLTPTRYSPSFSFKLSLSTGGTLNYSYSSSYGYTLFAQGALDTSSSLNITQIQLSSLSLSNVPFNIDSNSIVVAFYACLVYDKMIFDNADSSYITSRYYSYLNNRLMNTFCNSFVASRYQVLNPTSSDDSLDDWYNLGYQKGYNYGYNVGSEEGYDEGVATAQTASYQSGYQKGFTEGSKGDTHNSLSGLFLTAFQSPFHLFQQMFDIEFLGLNLGGFIISLFSLLLVAFIIKRLI